MTIPSNRDKNPTLDPEIASFIASNEPIAEEINPDDVIPTETNKDDAVVVPDVKEPVEPIVEPQKPTVEPKSDDIDYKDKFRASSQEALTLHFKNQKLQQTIEEASALPEPTEDEVRAYAKEQGEEYDDLTTLTKNILKKTLHNENKFQKISEAQQEARNIDDWVGKVEHFVDSPEVINSYPDILDNADEFKSFAMKQDRRGMNLQDLATSFLYNIGQVTAKKNKGAMLMQGGNGATEPIKPAGLTEDEAKVIRVSDPKQYRRLVKEGKIKIDF